MDGETHDAAFYDDLDETLGHAWRMLVRGAADRRSGLHTVQLATVAPDGGPRVRTLVLRGADPAGRTVRLHTDTRAEKGDHILAEPRVELCAYDPRAKIQIRLRGTAELQCSGALVDAAWAATGAASRVCYRAVVAPGAEIVAPALGDPTEAARNPDDPDAGRAHFSAMVIAVERLDWLYLAARGHRRAAFDWDGTGWQGRWLGP